MPFGIPIYDPDEEDFSTNGRGLLFPLSATVEWTAGGAYELEMDIPVDEDLRWTLAADECIIKAPVPMRESPFYEAASGSVPGQTITREIYEVDTNGGRLHLRQKPATSAKILAKYREGTEVVKLADAGSSDGYTWIQVAVVDGGATGYMATQWLQFVRSETETASETQPGSGAPVRVQPSRDQLFRVYSVEPDTGEGTIHIAARHIFYDLSYNIVNGAYAPEDVPIAQAAQQAFSMLLNAHDFTLTVLAEGNVTGDYGYKPFVEALLGDSDGMLAQAGALLVVDNYDIFILPPDGRDMGVTVRRGKNLKGVKVNYDSSDVITRIVPEGKNEEGDPLYLTAPGYVDSPRIAEYAFPRAKKIAYDVRVGENEGEFASEDAARAELVQLAQADFDGGIDLPTYGLDVDLVMLEDTEDYPDYANLQAIHAYDIVTVIDGLIGLTAQVRMTYYKANLLTGQYETVTLGEVESVEQAVTGASIVSGSVSGDRLIPGSVDGAMLRDLTVRYGKFTAATVQQLAADAFTAVKAHINELDAGSIDASKIDTASLSAAVANIVTLMVGSITADTIETDQLAAVLGDFLSLYSDYAGIDFADIKDMTVDEMIFRVGVGTELFIDRLVATNAFLASATLGNLIMRGEDGNYYRISVQSDGTVITTPVELTDEEIAAGETDDGKGVVDSDVDIPAMNGGQIAGSSAVISTILTDALTAGKITAGQALIASAEIPELYTTAINAIGNSIDITANSTIQMLIGVADAIRAWYTFSENGLEVGKAGSTYSTLTDDTGFHILQLDEKIGSFAKRRLITEAVQVGPVNASGMRIVMRSAYDGGVIFVPEEVS